MTVHDPQLQLREWLNDELRKAGHGAKSRLARHMSIAPDAVTRMLAADPRKERRIIKAHELQQMEQFFGTGFHRGMSQAHVLAEDRRSRGEPPFVICEKRYGRVIASIPHPGDSKPAQMLIEESRRRRVSLLTLAILSSWHSSGPPRTQAGSSFNLARTRSTASLMVIVSPAGFSSSMPD